MVTGLCRALLRDSVEAEDAAQQVFLSAHRSLLNGAEPREPAAWLATIARNECWARISGRMREPLPSAAAEEVESTDDPVAEAIRRADLTALWPAIRALPQQQREALLLREFGGLRYDELAAALAVSEPAVESLLFRARTRLRAQLQTAYAAVTGGAWLESLARLLASGGAPALATKAVALGLGAAAVTGTAVVAPQMLDHHPRPSTTIPQQAAPAQRATVAVGQARSLGFAPAVHHAARAHEPRSHDGGGGGELEHSGSRSGPRETTDSHDGSGDHEQGGDTQTAATTSGDREHSDGGGTSQQISGSGSGEDDSHDGSTITTTTATEPTTTQQTTTQQTTTVTTVAVPDLTVTTLDTSGSDGSDG